MSKTIDEKNNGTPDETETKKESLEYITKTKTEDLEIIFSHLRGAVLKPGAAIDKPRPRYILLAILEGISVILVPLFLKIAELYNDWVGWLYLLLSMIFTLIYLGILIYFFLGGIFDVIAGESFEEKPQTNRLEFNLETALKLRQKVENETISPEKVGLLKAFSAIIKNEIDYTSEASNIFAVLFTGYVSITLAASLITNDPNNATYKIFSIVVAGIASGFVVITKAKATARLKKLRRWLLISEMSQNL